MTAFHISIRALVDSNHVVTSFNVEKKRVLLYVLPETSL